MTRYFVILFTILIPFFSIAQEQNDPRSEKLKKLRPRKKMKIAGKLYEKGSYFNALTYYSEVYEKKPENIKALEKAAYINYLLRDYNKAEDL
jgi:hypothetical protein